MARKKKKTTDVKVVKKQPLNYAGSATIKILRGNKTISSKTFHNAGRIPLFKFLCNCLGGTYSEQLRPCKIKLFNYVGTATPNTIDWEADATWNWISEASSFVTYDAGPVVKLVQEVTSGDEVIPSHWETTYHFKVNSSYISQSAVNIIAIYGNNGANSKADASAYFLLKQTGADAWDPITFESANNNFSVVIEWTMTFDNLK